MQSMRNKVYIETNSFFKKEISISFLFCFVCDIIRENKTIKTTYGKFLQEILQNTNRCDAEFHVCRVSFKCQK